MSQCPQCAPQEEEGRKVIECPFCGWWLNPVHFTSSGCSAILQSEGADRGRIYQSEAVANAFRREFRKRRIFVYPAQAKGWWFARYEDRNFFCGVGRSQSEAVGGLLFQCGLEFGITVERL